MLSDDCDATEGVYEFRVHRAAYSHSVDAVQRETLILF
jgi:hypothetical protein